MLPLNLLRSFLFLSTLGLSYDPFYSYLLWDSLTTLLIPIYSGNLLQLFLFLSTLGLSYNSFIPIYPGTLLAYNSFYSYLLWESLTTLLIPIYSGTLTTLLISIYPGTLLQLLLFLPTLSALSLSLSFSQVFLFLSLEALFSMYTWRQMSPVCPASLQYSQLALVGTLAITTIFWCLITPQNIHKAFPFPCCFSFYIMIAKARGGGERKRERQRDRETERQRDRETERDALLLNFAVISTNFGWVCTLDAFLYLVDHSYK